MKFALKPKNQNVTDLKRSLAFYEEALGLKEVDRKECPDYTIVRLGMDGQLPSLLELTCYHREPIIYLSDQWCPFFEVEDFDAALAHHRAMGCIDKLHSQHMEGEFDEDYVITDPDDNWITIIPKFHMYRFDLLSFEDEKEDK